MSTVGEQLVIIAAVVLSLSACTMSGKLSGVSAPGMSAEQLEQQCETQGGVYLGGEDICAFGEGGP